MNNASHLRLYCLLKEILLKIKTYTQLLNYKDGKVQPLHIPKIGHEKGMSTKFNKKTPTQLDKKIILASKFLVYNSCVFQTFLLNEIFLLFVYIITVLFHFNRCVNLFHFHFMFHLFISQYLFLVWTTGFSNKCG